MAARFILAAQRYLQQISISDVCWM